MKRVNIFISDNKDGFTRKEVVLYNRRIVHRFTVAFPPLILKLPSCIINGRRSQRRTTFSESLRFRFITRVTQEDRKDDRVTFLWHSIVFLKRPR